MQKFKRQCTAVIVGAFALAAVSFFADMSGIPKDKQPPIYWMIMSSILVRDMIGILLSEDEKE
jgi:hypothetical protein